MKSALSIKVNEQQDWELKENWILIHLWTLGNKIMSLQITFNPMLTLFVSRSNICVKGAVPAIVGVVFTLMGTLMILVSAWCNQYNRYTIAFSCLRSSRYCATLFLVLRDAVIDSKIPVRYSVSTDSILLVVDDLLGELCSYEWQPSRESMLIFLQWLDNCLSVSTSV